MEEAQRGGGGPSAALEDTRRPVPRKLPLLHPQPSRDESETVQNNPETECTVCFGDLAENTSTDEVQVLLRASCKKHYGHYRCMVKTFPKYKYCPYCKVAVEQVELGVLQNEKFKKLDLNGFIFPLSKSSYNENNDVQILDGSEKPQKLIWKKAKAFDKIFDLKACYKNI